MAFLRDSLHPTRELEAATEKQTRRLAAISHLTQHKQVSGMLLSGAVASNRFLCIVSFGSTAKGERIVYLQCWRKTGSHFQLCMYDLEKVIQLFNG